MQGRALTTPDDGAGRHRHRAEQQRMGAIFIVMSAAGANRDHAQGTREQPYWDEHAAFVDQLVAEGFIMLGGPLPDEGGAVLVVRADSEAAVRERLRATPGTCTESSPSSASGGGRFSSTAGWRQDRRSGHGPRLAGGDPAAAVPGEQRVQIRVLDTQAPEMCFETVEILRDAFLPDASSVRRPTPKRDRGSLTDSDLKQLGKSRWRWSVCASRMFVKLGVISFRSRKTYCRTRLRIALRTPAMVPGPIGKYASSIQ
jgi:hypothetical protein